MPSVTNQVRLRTEAPSFQTGCIYEQTGKTLPAPRRQVGHMGCLQAHPSQVNHVPSTGSSPLLIHFPLPQSSLQQALPRTLGAWDTPCPIAETRPENRLPPHMKTCAKSRGISLGVSRFIPIFDSKNVLNILKRS